MYRQTIQLSESLPHFAASIQAADRKGYSDWEIVRWVDIEPKQVLPHQVTVVKGLKDDDGSVRERFPSRSPALLFSAKWLKNNVNASLDPDHWGVWYYIEDGKTIFQSVLPLRREHTAPKTLPAEAQPAADAQPRMPSRNLNTRLSDEHYHLLQTIAAEDNQTIRTVLEKALQYYDHLRFFAISHGEYTALQNGEDPGEAQAEDEAETGESQTDSVELVPSA